VTDLAERSWLDDAACRGMDAELFFPGRGEPSAAAKAVCRPCPVRFDCLSYALNNGEKHGIWGGLSERERRRLRRRIPVHTARSA
jgi:WhiB family redox-sensing transcriptional regulator